MSLPPDHDRWCLRFLNGAMRGRSITLRPGANALGAAADSAVLLPDTDARARHGVITAGEVAITLSRVDDAPVELNGEPLRAERRSLIAGDIVSVGRIDFQLDRLYADAAAGAGADAMFPDDDPPAPAPAREAPVLRRRAGWVGGVALASLSVCAGMLWWAGATPATATARAPDLAALAAALRDFPEAELRPADAAGVIQVAGFVETQARRSALTQLAAPFGPRVRVTAVAFDGVIDRARQFVADPGLAFSYRGRGHLMVSGATDLAGSRERVQRLGRDLYPLIVVEDQAAYKPPPASRGASAPGWADQLPARVVGITVDADGTRFIQLANGDRYFEGAVLRSGAEIGPLTSDDSPPAAGGEHAP